MDFNDLKGMFGELKTRMDAGIERVRRDMAHVRTGRATVGLLDGVHVEAYGSKMPINQVAALSIPEPALMIAQPFDPSLMGAIEKAIRSSDLGLNPANDGKVILAEYFGIYGNTVLIDHGAGLISLYGHMSSIDVKPGQMVKKKDALGKSGETGLAGGDHLHFGMFLHGVPVDPREWWDPKWITEKVLDRMKTAS